MIANIIVNSSISQRRNKGFALRKIFWKTQLVCARQRPKNRKEICKKDQFSAEERILLTGWDAFKQMNKERAKQRRAKERKTEIKKRKEERNWQLCRAETMGRGSKWSTLGSSEPQKANGGGCDGDGGSCWQRCSTRHEIINKVCCGGGGRVGHGYWHRKQLLRRSSDQLVESI